MLRYKERMSVRYFQKENGVFEFRERERERLVVQGLERDREIEGQGVIEIERD